MISRRDLLRRSTLISLAPTVPSFLARTVRASEPKRDARILVIIQLDGGNDGINTVVPYKDEGYKKNRRDLRLRSSELITLDERAGVGLNPALRPMTKLFEDGHLAVIQGVGYPNPSRSHFESMAIWHSARTDAQGRDGYGWLGRSLDTAARPAAGARGGHLSRSVGASACHSRPSSRGDGDDHARRFHPETPGRSPRSMAPVARPAR